MVKLFNSKHKADINIKNELSICKFHRAKTYLTKVEGVCLSFDFTLEGCIVEDPRKCSGECEVVWMSGSQESCKQQYRRPSNQPVLNQDVLNGHRTSVINVNLELNVPRVFLIENKCHSNSTVYP